MVIRVDLHKIVMKKYIFLSWSLICILFLQGCFFCPQKCKLAIDPSWGHCNFGKLQSNVNGYISELLLEISKIENIEFEVQYSNDSKLLQNLQVTDNPYDVVTTYMQPYNFNMKFYCLSTIVYQTGPVLLVNKQDNYRYIDDMATKKIGIVLGDKNVTFLQQYPDVVIITFPTAPEMLNSLERKNIEAALLERPLAISYKNNLYKETCKMIEPFAKEGLRFVTSRKGNCSIIMQFNRALQKLENKQVIEKLQKKWHLL